MKLFRNILSRVKKPESKKETTKATRTHKVIEAPALVFSGTKQCRKCLQVKTLDLFHYANASKDGRQSYCKSCQVKASRSVKVKKSRIAKRAAERASGLSRVITVKLIPTDLYERMKKISEGRGCTQQELFLDMIKTYLILHEKNLGA